MSVLPYGRTGDLQRLPDAAPQQAFPTAKTTGPHGMRADAVAAAVAAEQHAFAAAARAKTTQDAQAPATQRQLEPRQLLRQMYGTGRLRGQHPAFEQLWQGGEIVADADALLAEAARPSGDVDRLAQHPAGDPFERYLALLEARERVKERDASPAGQRLDAALERHWALHEAAILAGCNTAKPLMAFARNAPAWRRMRLLYTNLVVHDATLAATLKALIAEVGPGGVKGAVHAIRDALAADMASRIVSADRVRLVHSLLDLEALQQMSSLVAESDALCQALHRDAAAPEQVVGFVSGVLDHVGSAASANAAQRLTALCELLRPFSDADSAYVNRRVREFLKVRVPLGLWRNLELRDMLFPAVYRMSP